MIYNEEAYCNCYYRTIRELGAVPALVFNTIAGLLRTKNGYGEINNETLCELIGVTVQYLRSVIKKLISEGYIEKVAGKGRGNISIYYITEKGKQNIPFFDQKRETKPIIKGKQNAPKRETKRTLSNIYNTELNTGGKNVYAGAPAPAPTTTPTQEDFFKFWSLFCPDTSHDHDKENCFAVWQSMSESDRKMLLDDLRAGRRYKKTDNPYWYLKDWQAPLPFMRQGTQAFADWLDRARKDGKGVLLIKYPVDPNVPVDQAPLAYCLAEDKDKMLNAGAVLLGIFANK